jgi:hypothetical protein
VAWEPESPGYSRSIDQTKIPTADVPILTDDYAPTDALLLLFQ